MAIPHPPQEPPTTPHTGAYRGLLYGSAALLAAACSTSVETEGRTGQWLVDLGSVQCSANPVVGFSADRNWMLFWIEHFQPDSGMRFPLVSPALLEVDSRRLVLPAGPVDRGEGPSFSSSSLCRAPARGRRRRQPERLALRRGHPAVVSRDSIGHGA